MRISVVIPAWNEVKTIQHAVREVRAVLDGLGGEYEVIVVDDGSTDGMADAIPSGVRMLRHASNQGKGAAVRTGVLAAVGDWVVVMDADLSTHPAEMQHIQQAMTTADVIIGSRRVPGAVITRPQALARDYSGRLFNAVVRLWLRLPYRDTQCGFKAFRRATVQPLFVPLHISGWAFDVEVLMRATHAGLRIVEVPVRWRNGDETRVRWKDAWSIVRDLRALLRLH